MKRNKKERLPIGQHWAEIKPQYWHEWGDEGRGMVSTFAYDTNEDYHFTGKMPKDTAIANGLKFKNPYR